MPSYQTLVDSRAAKASKDAKEKKKRQMAGLRDLAAIRRNPSALQSLGIYNAPAFRMAGEVKALDVPIANYTLNATAQITPLNLIRAGSSFCNRIGRKINLKNIHLKAWINPVRTAANTDYCRVMIVYDAQTNGALPAIADILQDTDQAAANTTNSLSGGNLNNRDRFRVLCDWRLPMPSITITAGVATNIGLVDPVENIFDLHRYIKLKGLPTQFKADSSPAVIGDIATGGLYLVTFGSVAAGAEGYQLSCTTRLRYTDV